MRGYNGGKGWGAATLGTRLAFCGAPGGIAFDCGRVADIGSASSRRTTDAEYPNASKATRRGATLPIVGANDTSLR